ncbi:MAG: DNA-binding response regulator [Phycisphaerales bacterium]|nr:DNA-binding response regulator [Phycisphaerales bacterium]
MLVLLVDFEPKEAAHLTDQLEAQNLTVEHVLTTDSALAAITKQSYRVIVVGDTVMGGPNAFTQALRAAGHGNPVVVLTHDADPATKVSILDCGADDVLVHPFPPEMLAAQIRSLLRRCRPSEGAILKFEDLSLDLRSLQVTRQGQIIPSTSRELAVLEYLMRNCQRVISRTELSEAIWNDSALPGSNVIEVFIARLRRKVDRPFDVPLIHTIVGRGYMMSVTKPGTPETTPAMPEQEA